MGLLKRLREFILSNRITIDDKLYIGDILGNIIDERSYKKNRVLLIRKYMIIHKDEIDKSVKLSDFIKEAKYSVMEIPNLNKKNTVVFSIIRNENPNIDIISALKREIDIIVNILDDRIGDNFKASNIGCGLIRITKINKGRN